MRQQLLRSERLRARVRLLRAEDGFTLIELVVTIAVASVVLAALFMISETTSTQTSLEFSRVDATSRTETAIENLENELHSACVADATPILAGSTATTLMFVSQYGSEAAVEPVEHVVTFNASARTLTDAQYAETGYTTDSSGQTVYTFSSTPISGSTKTLTNVSQTGSTPVFQYFAFQEPLQSNGSPYEDSAGYPYMMLLDGTSDVPGTSTIPTPSPLADSSGLSSTNAANAAEVLITLSVGPQGYLGENTAEGAAQSAFQATDSTDQISDGVVLRMTPPANFYGNGNVFLPCQ
jgi:prepilin-type N-terminal cleavage/methylation domain-containing protein